MPPTLPRFVALCGNPLSGKSTAGKLLESMGYGLVDDGGPMRKMAIEHFGASHDDVYTQEGKLRTTKVNGVVMTWRDVLGRLGPAKSPLAHGEVRCALAAPPARGVVTLHP